MLAIVIPYYKFTFFDNTLKALANQTDQRFKVYIGDDASTKNPVSLLEKYSGQFNFVYHRFENNLGGTSLTQHWERCIALSGNEEWIMILGDDDVLGENVVEEFYKNLLEIEKNKYNVIRIATCKINESGENISKIYLHPKIENIIDFFFSRDRSSLSEHVFRKEKIMNIGFKNFPLGWCSDTLAIMEMTEFKYIYSINDSIVFIRISKVSISGKNSNLQEKNRAACLFLIYLLNVKKQVFSEGQKNILLEELKRILKRNKKDVYFVIKIFLKILSKLTLKEFHYFLKIK